MGIIYQKGFGVNWDLPIKDSGALLLNIIKIRSKMWVLVHLNILNLFPRNRLYWSRYISRFYKSYRINVT